MNIKETKVAKHFDIALYRFIWFVVVLIVGGTTAWVTTQHDIEFNTVFGQETRVILVEHIDDTKGDPLSEAELQHKVENLEDDVTDHNAEIIKHDTMLIAHDKSIAIQKVQYENILEKLEMISKKLDE